MDDGSWDPVAATIDQAGRAFLIGVPEAAIPTGRPIRLIATVGSSMMNNDDLPDEGAIDATFPTQGER
jgi:hypothetical protein